MIEAMREGGITGPHAGCRTVCLLKINYGGWGRALLRIFQEELDRRIAWSAHQAGFSIIQLTGDPILIKEALHFRVATALDQIRYRRTKGLQRLQYPFSFLHRAGVTGGYTDSRVSIRSTVTLTLKSIETAPLRLVIDRSALI
jgi:hypothetical protein